MNEYCGEDFMAGTICTDYPGHDGAHSAFCQECQGDWYMGCECTCDECGLYEDDCDCDIDANGFIVQSLIKELV